MTDAKESHRIGIVSVDSDCVMVTSRFRVRNPWLLFLCWRDFQRIKAQLREYPVDGLIEYSFAVSSPTTFLSVSIWKDWESIPPFGTSNQAHIEAGNQLFGRVRTIHDGSPEVWSTRWKLEGVSNNDRWVSRNGDLVDLPFAWRERE